MTKTYPKHLFLITLLFGVVGAAFGEDNRPATDAEFWESVYSENHVLNIEISLTDENWQKMQPANQRGGRGGGRNDGPPNRGRPDGPPPNGGPPNGRPQGPPPGGQGRGGPSQDRGGPQGRPERGGRQRPEGRNGRGNGGPPANVGNEFTYVKAEIVVDGEKFTDAGIRFKGNSSYRFSANGMKRPMKFDFNKFTQGQKLHGRDKLNLSTSALDSAFMKEKLAYGLYKSAGLATPGVGWANVSLKVGSKSVPLGIYVLIEQVDKKFVENNFGKSSKGSLLMKPEVNQWEYLGDKPEDYASYDVKTGDEDVEQFQRFGELMKLIQDGSAKEFEDQIGERFDLPQLASYLAATSMLSSLDSYVAAPHNYYLMLDKADGKVRMLPWDVNESFAAHTRGTNLETLVDWDIDRPWVANRRLLERLFETETFPAMYRKAVQELIGDFTEEKLFPRIEEYRKAIAPHVGKYKAGTGTKGLKAGIDGDRDGINRAVERQVLAIKPFIQRRNKSVKEQLAGTREGKAISQQRRR